MVQVPPAIVLEFIDHKTDPELSIVKVTEDCYITVKKKNLKDFDAIINKVLEDCDEEIEAEIKTKP